MEVGRRPEECEIVEICFTVRGADERRDVAVMNLQSPTPVSASSPPRSALLTPPLDLTTFLNVFKFTESFNSVSFC